MKKLLTGLAVGAFLVCGGVNTVHATPTLIASATWASNGNQYSLYSDTNSGIIWEDAQQWVTNNLPGYYLATITSAAENAFVFSSVIGSNPGEFWLGSLQNPITTQVANDNWTWSDGEPWSYTNWASGEPNDFYGPGSEQHLSINFFGDGTWNDEYDFPLVGFLVEKSASPVPEPATMLLFGAGLAGLAVVRRKKTT